MPNDDGLIHPHLERLRAYAAGLPESSEVEAWGHPTFRAGKRIFATYGFYDGRHTMSAKQSLPDQALLVSDPRFWVSAYVGKHGWVTFDIDRVPWETAEELIERSYRLVANKRMLRALDEAAG